MKTFRNTLKNIFALSFVALLFTAYLPLIAPSKASAAGETFTWQGDKIVISGGNISDPKYWEPTSITLTKNGDVYTGQQGFKTGSAILCYYKYSLKLTGTAADSGILTVNADDCPGAKKGDVVYGDVKVGGTAPASLTTAGTGDQLCNQVKSGGLGWILCSFGQYLMDGLTAADNWILERLTINTDSIFNTGTESGVAFRTAWSIFRNIAYALLIVIGLIMVVSQVMGLDMFDAYTIRKMLPKLVAAAIFIPLLWPLLKLGFEMANDAGFAIMELIKAPFADIGRSIGLPDEITAGALLGGSIAGIGGVAAFFAIGGWGVFLAMLGSAFLFVISALFILAARDVVAYALIIASPVAVICATFEPFQKVFTFWKTFLLTIWLSIPAVGAVLAASKVAAKIAIISNKNWGLLLALVFLIVGYALFWKIFQSLDKVSGQLGNVVSGVTGKAQKALSDYRGETRKRRMNEAMQGKRTFGGIFGGAGNAAADIGRRFKVKSTPGGSFFGPGYTAARQKIISKAAQEMVKDDEGRAGGDDEAMQLLAQGNMNKSRFVAGLMATGATRAQAVERLRSAEANLGAQAGTSAMAVAAQNALLASNTSYRATDYADPDQAYQQMYTDVARQVIEGRMSVTDAAASIGSNKQRADRSGAGFSTRMAMVSQAVERVRQGQQALTVDDVSTLRNEAITGSEPGAIIGGRHETVTQLAPEMLRRFQTSAAAYQASGSQQDYDVMAREAAGLAGVYDSMQHVSRQKAGIMADGVMSQTIWEGGPTVQAAIEDFRSQGVPAFLEARREFDRGLAQYNAAAGGGAPPGGGVPPIPTAGALGG
jgi:hypothetical protein